MKVLFLPSWYPVDNEDYAGCFFRELAIALSKNGVDVSVIAPIFYTYNRFNDYLTTKVSHHTVDDSVNTYRVKAFFRFPISSISNALDWYLVSKRMIDNYISLNGVPDVVHIQSSIYAGVISKYIKEKYKIPMFLTEHSSVLNNEKIDFFKRKLFHFTCSNMEKKFTVSSDFQNKLSKLEPGSKWEVIHNAVNVDFFDSKKKDVQESNVTRLVHVSNLTENKNVILIIKSLERIIKKNKSVKLKIIGDGPTRSYLQKYISDNGMQNFVEFLGVLSRERVKEEVLKSDIFLLSSFKETFGVVVIEALSLGLPVISTMSGGVNDTITSENGKLTNFTVNDFSNAIISMIEELHSFDSLNIKNKAFDKYHPDAISKLYIKEYTEIVNV